MDSKDKEELSQVQQLLQRIADAEAAQRAGKLYEIGVAAFSNQAYALSMAELEAVVEIGDPFYSANALWILLSVYKRVGDSAQERATLTRIVSLKPESRRFIDPENLGIAYVRLGEAHKAVECYSLAIKLNGENPSRLANLAEAYLVAGDYRGSLGVSEKLIPQGEVKYALLGRIFKGASLWFMNQTKEALNEFQFVGNSLVSTGGIPQNFSWDFRDSESVFRRMESPVIQSVLQTLSGKTDFSAFRQIWTGLVVTA